MATQMSLHAHPRYLIATDAGAFILSVLVLFVIFRVRLLLSPLAFTVLVILMAAGFGVDIGRWFARGVRLVEVDGNRLTLYSGPGLTTRVIEGAPLSQARVRQGIGRRTVILKPVAGRRVSIREDAFPREEFARFLHFIRDRR